MDKVLKNCASHSRYFSDELGALFFENKQNKCLEFTLAFGPKPEFSFSFK